MADTDLGADGEFETTKPTNVTGKQRPPEFVAGTVNHALAINADDHGNIALHDDDKGRETTGFGTRLTGESGRNTIAPKIVTTDASPTSADDGTPEIPTRRGMKR